MGKDSMQKNALDKNRNTWINIFHSSTYLKLGMSQLTYESLILFYYFILFYFIFCTLYCLRGTESRHIERMHHELKAVTKYEIFLIGKLWEAPIDHQWIFFWSILKSLYHVWNTSSFNCLIVTVVRSGKSSPSKFYEPNLMKFNKILVVSRIKNISIICKIQVLRSQIRLTRSHPNYLLHVFLTVNCFMYSFGLFCTDDYSTFLYLT